jgi:hypothetical protein
MFKSNFLVVLATLSAASGCTTSKYFVNFDSTPQGASLVCSGTNYGYTPVTLYYDKSVKTQSYLNVSNCSAVWSSGVSAAYSAYLPVYSQGGTNTTLPRPDAPGFAQDAEFALKVQQMKQAAQQAQVPAAPRTVTCTTNFGVTTCY